MSGASVRPVVLCQRATAPGAERNALVWRWLAGILPASLLLASACARLNSRNAPSPENAWPSTMAATQTFISIGRFDSADSTLASFAAMYPGTAQARETEYYRALFKLDPSSPHPSVRAAIASLDEYLSDRRPRQHVAEAETLRRVAGQIDGLNRTAASALAEAREAAITAQDARADAIGARDSGKSAADATPTTETEVKRLKDELAKANAELERIRKRLVQVPPKRP